MRVYAIALLVTLGGCATQQQITATDDSVCRSYGAQPGSEAYVQCRMMKDQQHQDAAQSLLNAGSAMNSDHTTISGLVLTGAGLATTAGH
jgi:hypothetical protein